MQTLYRIGVDDRTLAAAVLRSAFHEEIEILTQKYSLKQRAAEELFSTPLGLGLSRGEVYASSERIEGLIAVLPGEHANSGLISLLTSGAFFRSLGALKLMMRKDVRTILSEMSQDKKALNLGPYYYVAVLGVARDHQGKGIGGRLLAALCERADAEGRALYLETQTSRNVAWYEGYGFRVRKSLGSADTMQIWEMARARR
jgi:ribosomal protein S18 acetylase RimI-like enzyme